MSTVTFYPLNKRVEVPSGTTILEAAARADITIGNLCGGEGICGRCKMIVIKGEISAEVTGKLTRDQIQHGYVLACLATVLDGDVLVEIPHETLATDKVTAHEASDRFWDLSPAPADTGKPASPLVRKIYLELEEPSLASNMPDHQRICAGIRKGLDVASTQTGLKVIKAIPDLLRESGFKVTATVGIRADIAEVMYLEPGDTSASNYIAAVDMGTTTVVVHLVDAVKCTTVAARACFNSQGMHGAEVTTRMMAAEKKGCEELQRLLVVDINTLITELAQEFNVKLSDITAVVCAGNTAMAHFLLGLPIQNIRRTPYIATTVEAPPVRAAEVGVRINPRGLLYSLPGIGSWVGSDLTAGILAAGINTSDKLSLLVDIGTNGEVVVGSREWLMVCSASAGPALEGASVECGMRAESGAIERVSFDGAELTYQVIGTSTPRGLCGSGIIDCVAALLQAGLINRSGKFTADNDRIVLRDGVKAYFLVKDQEAGNSAPIYVSESDIENIINAKAAIYAAMKILLQRLDLSFGALDRFMIAGAFGNYINPESAMAIGLIPRIAPDRIEFVGNTSIKGAKMVALHREAFEDVVEIERNTTYYDLMGANDYVEEFQKAMFLPHTDIEEFARPGTADQMANAGNGRVR